MTTSLEPEGPVSGDAQWALNEKRERTDKQWARAFWISLAAAAAAGTCTWLNRNTLYGSFDTRDAFLDDPASCGVSDAAGASPLGRFLLSRTRSTDLSANFERTPILSLVGVALLVTAVVAALLPLALAQLYRRAAPAMVSAPLYLLIGVCAVGAAASFATGQVWWCVGLLLGIGFLVWAVSIKRAKQGRFALIARVLAVASDALLRNQHVAAFCGALSVAAAATGVIVVLGAQGAGANGRAVRNADVAQLSDDGGNCLDAHGTVVPCCAWRTSILGYFVLGFLCTVWFWAIFVASQIITFTIAGSITQWFFRGESRGAMRRSLCHATTVHLGSLCLLGSPLAATPFARRACGAPLARCSVAQVAATGEPLLPASRSATATLARHGLCSDAADVQGGTLLFAVYALAVVLTLVLTNFLGSFFMASPLTFMCTILLTYSLTYSLWFAEHLLSTVADTLLLCYARDLDAGTVSQPSVHAVYSDLPKRASAAVSPRAMEARAAGPAAAAARRDSGQPLGDQ